jgi:hypothetical protein
MSSEEPHTNWRCVEHHQQSTGGVWSTTSSPLAVCGAVHQQSTSSPSPVLPPPHEPEMALLALTDGGRGHHPLYPVRPPVLGHGTGGRTASPVRHRGPYGIPCTADHPAAPRPSSPVNPSARPLCASPCARPIRTCPLCTSPCARPCARSRAHGGPRARRAHGNVRAANLSESARTGRHSESREIARKRGAPGTRGAGLGDLTELDVAGNPFLSAGPGPEAASDSETGPGRARAGDPGGVGVRAGLWGLLRRLEQVGPDPLQQHFNSTATALQQHCNSTATVALQPSLHASPSLFS